MLELEISKFTVEDLSTGDFEAAAVSEIGRVRDDSTVTFCGYFRRSTVGTTLLPSPPRNTTEYVRLLLQDSSDPRSRLFIPIEMSAAAVSGHLPVGAVRTERVPFDRFAEGVIRAHEWRPGTLLHFGILRFKIPVERAEAFEGDVRRELSMILANEPGTMAWGYVRRPEGAQGIFPSAVDGVVEYLHLLSYLDEASRQFHSYIEHRGEWDRAGPYFTFDGDWAWGTAYRGHLASPYESEFFRSDTFITGTSRNVLWGAGTEDHK